MTMTVPNADTQTFVVGTERSERGYLIHDLSSRDGGLSVAAFDHEDDRARSHASVGIHEISKLTADTFTATDGTPSVTLTVTNSTGQRIRVSLWGITPAQLVAAVAPTL